MGTESLTTAAAPGYFDANATAPLCPAAREAWLAVAGEHWQNPSSLYPAAAAAKERLADARWRLAEVIGGEPETLVFTSGATEANNALFRMLAGRWAAHERIAISGLEHPAVALPAHESFGARVIRLRTITDGRVCLDSLKTVLAAADRPRLVSVMAANNETGVLQPWREIATICREAGVWFHCDASQWLGKMPADGLAECAFVTGSGHKLGGPKGTGFLKLPDEDDRMTADWQPVLQHGGAQEADRRAGTEDVAGASAMVAALEARTTLVTDPAWREQRTTWRDAFEQRLIAELEGLEIVGGGAARLWNTSMLVLPPPRNLKWLTRLARRGFAVSTGSACSAGADKPSAVLASMAVAPDAMSRVLRFSSLWETEGTEWHALADAVIDVAHELAG